MPLFTPESLDALRQRIDIVEVLSPHIELKRSGASYKALCPFHEEKNPSFMVQKGDSHYHCYGCGAHGDGIQFLMTHLKMGFTDAIETLAQKFGVPLETVEGNPGESVNKGALKHACEAASQLYEFFLLHTELGLEALAYLYSRGIDLEFIKQFRLGYAPNQPGLLQKVMHEKRISNQNLLDAGLVTQSDTGKWRDFFADRITFPICDASGSVIGFSARKYKETTFGGKYVNTSETPLFKKSKVLFGLHHSRRRIAKERKAIIVEGQIDALKLIASGFNITVAGQGTAFGEGHAKELLNLGVTCVYLAMDGDNAGQQATVKIGDIFQREGVEVKILSLPAKMDPDSFLRERGVEAFGNLMIEAKDYITFLIETCSREIDVSSPAAKNELVSSIVKQIRSWKHPLMVHESLKKVSQMLSVPQEVIGLEHVPNLYIKKASYVGLQSFDPIKNLEANFLVWFVHMNADQLRFLAIAKKNITVADLQAPECAKIYQMYLEGASKGRPCDLLTIASKLDEGEQYLIQELVNKKINRDKSEELFIESMQNILTRNWMQQRDLITQKIKACSDDEASFDLLRMLNLLQKSPPTVNSNPENTS